MDRKDGLLNALTRGLYAPVLEYVYTTGDRKTVLELIDKVLGWKIDVKVKERLAYLKEALPRLKFVKRGDGWIMAMLGENVIAWLKDPAGERVNKKRRGWDSNPRGQGPPV